MLPLLDGGATSNYVKRWKCQQVRYFCFGESVGQWVTQVQRRCGSICIVWLSRKHEFTVFMAFPTCLRPPHELSIQDFPKHDAYMPASSCNSILFPLPQHDHEFSVVLKFICWLKRCTLILCCCFLGLGTGELSWAVEECLMDPS